MHKFHFNITQDQKEKVVITLTPPPPTFPSFRLGEEFKAFLAQVHLKDQNNQSISKNVVVPEQYKNNSMQEMYLLSENLYNTYAKVLKEYYLNVRTRDQLMKQSMQIKSEIDVLEKKIYGSIRPPFALLSKNYTDPCIVDRNAIPVETDFEKRTKLVVLDELK